jgi:ATP-dependent Clp protease ATP-binding subunit ClpB
MLTEQAKVPPAHWVDNSAAGFRDKVMEDLKTFFRPEFLNRVDEIVIFNPLTREILKKIVEIQVGRMKRYLMERNIDLVLTDRAKEYFGSIGFDPIYGARPLKRVLQKTVLNELARTILEGTFTDGDTVEVDYQNEKIIFTRMAAAGVTV